MASPQFFGCIKIIELPNLLSPHLLKKSIDKKMGVTIYYLQKWKNPNGVQDPSYYHSNQLRHINISSSIYGTPKSHV